MPATTARRPPRSSRLPAIAAVADDVTRRGFLGLLAAAGLLAACGDDDDAGGTATTAGDFPRTVGRGFAAATIPARPTRVVATADRDQLDVLLAMGLQPVLYGFSGDYDPTAPWLDAQVVAEIDQAGMTDAFTPNLERIAAARPDLIIDAWADEVTHASLAQIAPTIQVKLDNTDTWQAAQRLAGAATGQEAAAETAIARTEEVLADQRARLTDLGELSVAVAFQDGGELVVIPGAEIGARTLTELGVTVHPTPDGASGRFSLEEMEALLGGADVIVSFDYGGLDAQESNPLFRALPAVAAGRYVALDIEVATACYQESTLSVRWAAAAVADALLAAAAGDGRTLG